jgi:hypothetical protein
MFVVISFSIKEKRPNATAEGLFFEVISLLSYGSKLTEGVTDVVVARTKNSLICAIKEAEELILRRIEMTGDHLDLARDRKA